MLKDKIDELESENSKVIEMKAQEIIKAAQEVKPSKPQVVIKPTQIIAEEKQTTDNSCQTLNLKMFDTSVSCQTTPSVRSTTCQTAIEETKEIEVYDKDGSRNKVVIRNISNFNNVENKVSIVNINQYSKKFDG